MTGEHNHPSPRTRFLHWCRRVAYTATGFYAAILMSGIAHDGVAASGYLTPGCDRFYYLTIGFWMAAALLDLATIISRSKETACPGK